MKVSNQSPHRGWQMLEKLWGKSWGPFRLGGGFVKIPYLGIRKIVPYVPHRKKIPIPQRVGNMRRSPGGVGLEELGEELPQESFQPTPSLCPLWMQTAGWGDVHMGSNLQLTGEQ